MALLILRLTRRTALSRPPIGAQRSAILQLGRCKASLTCHHRNFHCSASLLEKDHSSKALIVCIGWLGSKQKHFMKYTELWHRLGHQTVSVRPPTRSIIVPSLGDRSAQGFLEEIDEAQRRKPSRPTVYHIFSNAGFIYMGTMLRLLALQDENTFRQIARHPERVRMLGERKSGVPLSMLDPTQGIILDSTPARLTPDIAARGLTAALLSQAAADVEVRHPHMTRVTKAALQPFLAFPPISTRIHEVWGAWQAVAPVKPQLFLTSQADALIPPAEIELFMKQQASRGVHITSRQFSDSAHCEHYRRYPAEYCSEVESFVSNLP